jgi:hypothetical protein
LEGFAGRMRWVADSGYHDIVGLVEIGLDKTFAYAWWFMGFSFRPSCGRARTPGEPGWDGIGWDEDK